MEHGTLLQRDKSKPYYGQDVPGMVRDDLIIGGILAIQGIFLRWWSKKSQSGANRLIALLSGISILIGVLATLDGVAIVWSSQIVKLWERDRLLNRLKLRGNERVLDLGCGHGLLLIGAAKRLPSGRAVGVDLWSQIDQGQNAKEETLANAQLEGVEDRVEIHDGDMRYLPFADASFDVVVANLAVHNVESPEGRHQVAQEIRRVLKPGGRIALIDIFHVKQIAGYLRQSGILDVHISRPRILHYPPTYTITGRK